MTSTHGKKIHPFRYSGVNPRPAQQGAAQQPQQLAPQPSLGPRAPSTAPLRPQDARTLREGADGMLRAAGRLRYAIPRFPDTRGSWVQVGAHQCRTPQNSIVSVIRSRDGREFGIVAGTLSDDGRIWILADTPDGVRELVGLPPGALADIRETVFGR